ncbi:MAG: HAD hydrolase-like protein [Clostridiales bacterium]|jgi:phosphoglycolate phosphatase|nr:HAD hydrolase-like protein [Clostridiales bacterium]
MKKYQLVIWDWNGTLLNDVNWCVDVINAMLAKRRLKTLDGLKAYQGVFGFPIIDYYKKLGFDFEEEPFGVLAKEYIELYHSKNSGGCGLHKNAVSVLDTLNKHVVTQVVLSASEIGNLRKQMSGFNIDFYFDEVLGLCDIYAKSKVEIGLDYINRKRIGRAVLIGDTQHDAEVASKIGADCLLVCSGHHSREKLEELAFPVLDDVAQVLDYIL